MSATVQTCESPPCSILCHTPSASLSSEQEAVEAVEAVEAARILRTSAN